MAESYYRIRKVRICPAHELYSYCDRITAAANNLSNAVRFRQRQVITAVSKEPFSLSDNEREVLAELEQVSFVPEGKKHRLSYSLLDRLMKVTGNRDYYCSGLPRQSAQHTIKQCVSDMDSYWKALKAYHDHPECFTGRPKFPGYHRKGGHCTAVITNQDAVIEAGRETGASLKLPFTRTRLKVGHIGAGWHLKEVRVIPDNGTYVISSTFEVPASVCETSPVPSRIAGVDLGVNNLMAVTTNCGLPCLLFKGGIAKSANRIYNKKTAHLVSEQMARTGRKYVPDAEYYRVTVKRNDRISDLMHKEAKLLVKWCVENRIDTIVLGSNALWKQETGLGHVNNQNFVQIPFDLLKRTIGYLAGSAGIRIVLQEESYTSRASFPDMDPIPVYSPEDDTVYTFSGRRRPVRYKGVHKAGGFRGLYVAGDGTVINSDLNGSANILRKAFPHAFDGTSVDFSDVKIVRDPDLADGKKKIRVRSGETSHTKQKRLLRKGTVLKSSPIGIEAS